MKKLVLMLAVVFSVSLFSCGGAEKAAENDSTACEAPECCEADTLKAEADSLKAEADTTQADATATETPAETPAE